MLATVKQLGADNGLVAFDCPHCKASLRSPFEFLVDASRAQVERCDGCGEWFRIDPDALLQWEMLHREVRNAG
jgi:sarcosine oxidase delta subunit